jgi:hypothetical protein
MRTHPTLVASIVAAASILATEAPCSATCTPARTGAPVRPLAGPWRAALDELLRTSVDPDQPWGCTGALVDLADHDGVATLIVIGEDGHAVSREVAAPEDVVPMGRALLMQPNAPAIAATLPAVGSPPRPAPSAESKQDLPNIKPKAPADATELPPQTATADRPSPSALVSVLLSPRFAGKSNLLVGGFAVHAAVPIDLWDVGGWLRYDPLSASTDDRHRDSLDELCLGGSAGRTFPFDGFDLRTSLLGSAVIVMPSDGPGRDKARIDGRAGLELRNLFHVTELLSFAVALDAELAPAQLAAQDPPRGDHEPPSDLPSYTIGLGLGAELAP